MSEEGTVVGGPPPGALHVIVSRHQLVGCLCHRPGRHHSGDRHRPGRGGRHGLAAIPAIALVVIIGLIVCLCMGELAALLPHRTGGMPSYAYESFQPLGQTTAKHIGGISSWGYWLGWFPVAPINMLLAAGYIAVLFHVPLGRSVLPLGFIGAPVSIGVLLITFFGLIGLFIPCYLGIRLGATFATILGVVSMIPLTLLVFLPIFKPCSFHFTTFRASTTPTPKRPASCSSWVGSSSSHGTPSPWRRRPVTSANVVTRPEMPRSR